MEEGCENGADFRVNVKSKKHIREQLEKYKDLFKKLLDGQCHISEEDKAKLLQEMVVVSVSSIIFCLYQVYHSFTIETPSVLPVVIYNGSHL